MNKLTQLRRETPLTVVTPTALYLSTNAKTGASINTAIALTCRPTKACASYCYGLGGRIRLKPALRRQADNVARFDFLASAPEEVVREEARRLATRVLRKQNFLRFFGVGDLQPGSVRFINCLAEEAPSLALWVATRRLDLAAQLAPLTNVWVMLGVDATTKAPLRAKARQLIRTRAPQFYGAWVQQSARERIPKWVSVVFAEHHFGGRAHWTADNADPRTCPATIKNGAPHDGACAACRFCFDASVALPKRALRIRHR